MDLSNEDAQKSLSLVENTMAETRKSLTAAYSGPILILWGLIWILDFLGTHLFLKWVWLIWMVLNCIGVIGMVLICRQQFQAASPTRHSADDKIGRRIFWFWAFLGLYGFIWLAIFRPVNGIEINAFLCTVIMFAYVMMGLWTESHFMIWLGLAVTVATLVGFFLVPPNYYCLWMAPTAGGLLFGTGLWARFCWS